MDSVINQEELNEFMKDGWSYPTKPESSGGVSPDNPVFTGSISLGRKEGTTVGAQSFAVGNNVEAKGNYSHAEGDSTHALGIGSHAEGKSGYAIGNYSHVEARATDARGMDSHAEGFQTQADGNQSHAEGDTTEASGQASHAGGYCTIAANFAGRSIGKYNKNMTTGASYKNNVGDVLVVGNGSSISTADRSNAFRVTYAGETYGLAAFNTSGADYAEFFEWFDGNPDNEDRVGKFVTMAGNKIRIASDGDYILGIVSGLPCIIGNADEDWLGRWMRDEFGRLLTKEVEDINEETGEKIVGWAYVANPEYDSTQKYIERKNRPEWSAVGMLGALSVYDDGTCEVDGYAQVNVDGIATKANSYMPGVTYRVIERVTDKVVKVIFR